MRRVLCVWLPTFSTDLVKRRQTRSRDESERRESVVMLTRAIGAREIVEHRCARAVGVRQGMDLTHARSILPRGVHAHIEPHRPDRDTAALRALACWALRFSPCVGVDGADGLLLDVTGTEGVHRGEARLIRSAAAAMRRLGFAARVCAASTFGCAWGVARYGKHDLSRVPRGKEREAMAPLPTSALRLDDETSQRLGEIGLTKVEHLLRLPRSSLVARFDESLVRRVKQALGELDERIEFVREESPLRREVIFDGPTDRWESIEAAARYVLEALAQDLAKRERGVRRLEIEFLRPGQPAQRMDIELSRPSRAIKHLWTLMRSRLERVDPGDGVEGVVLTAARTARLRHAQSASRALGAEDEPGESESLGVLVDTLVSRLGADHVSRMELIESHMPERAFRVRSAMEVDKRAKGGATRANRPTVLYEHPEPAEVMALTPDGPVLSIGWRGGRWKAVSCSGPERIAGEWWRGGGMPEERDYFMVELDDGRWVWVYRWTGAGRWCVHGEWS